MQCPFIEEVMMPPAPRFSMTQAVILMVALTVVGCTSDGNRPVPENDVPAIAFLDPAYVVEDQVAFHLFVHGQGFNPDSVVRWNGDDRITTLSNPSPGEFILRASITSVDVAHPTTAEITVFNPDPGGGLSNAVDFRVYDPADLSPVPTISTVDPTFVSHDREATLTVHGSGFVSGSSVIWTPAATTTGYTETNVTVANDNELTVLIPAGHVTPSGAASLEVVNPVPGGGTSNPVTVSVL